MSCLSAPAPAPAPAPVSAPEARFNSQGQPIFFESQRQTREYKEEVKNPDGSVVGKYAVQEPNGN